MDCDLRWKPGTCCPDNPNCEHEYKKQLREKDKRIKELQAIDCKQVASLKAEVEAFRKLAEREKGEKERLRFQLAEKDKQIKELEAKIGVYDFNHQALLKKLREQEEIGRIANDQAKTNDRLWVAEKKKAKEVRTVWNRLIDKIYNSTLSDLIDDWEEFCMMDDLLDNGD